MFTMKKYVGAAKSFPDSRTPRRLPYETITMNSNGGTTGRRGGMAEASGGAGRHRDGHGQGMYPMSRATPETWASPIPKLSLVTT